MNYQGTRSSDTENTATKYHEFATKDFAKQMVESKHIDEEGFSFEVGTSIGTCGSKGCVPVAIINKQDKSARNSGAVKFNSRMTRLRQQCTPKARSTRQLRRNERERGRKARLNAAFQVLRSVVPNNVSSAESTERKMTQVEILRLAKNYISNLTEILKQDSGSYAFGSYRT